MTTLQQYVSAATSDEAFVAECTARATAMVDSRIGGSPVPEAIRELAILEVGADLYHRRGARNGVASFDGGPDSMVSPMRIARDPMQAANAILRPYLGPGLA